MQITNARNKQFKNKRFADVARTKCMMLVNLMGKKDYIQNGKIGERYNKCK